MVTLEQTKIEPLLKWAGGKRWLVETLKRHVSTPYSRLIEPFCGGAATFFGLRPPIGILSDLNRDLIQTYSTIRNHPDEVIEKLSALTNDAESYYSIRASVPTCPVAQAARTYYLCRHSFNGIYRVNQRGEFNVPYNHKTWREPFDLDHIKMASSALQNAELITADFEQTLSRAQCGDLVYCDPPYTVAHNHNGFLKYNERIFSFDDQRRLASAASEAAARGAVVFVSNADHACIRELYRQANIHTLSRHSIIGSKAEYRKRVSELLIELKH